MPIVTFSEVNVGDRVTPGGVPTPVTGYAQYPAGVVVGRNLDRNRPVVKITTALGDQWGYLDTPIHVFTGTPDPVDPPVEHEYVILVGVSVTSNRDSEEAELWLHQRLNEPEFRGYPANAPHLHEGTYVDSWWIAEDQRSDGSDSDSAVFVPRGMSQVEARDLLWHTVRDASGRVSLPPRFCEDCPGVNQHAAGCPHA